MWTSSKSERMNPFPTAVERILSGGQTGADRAALDFAIAHGIPHGGWCPRGRLAEDGPIAERYQLEETPDAEYAQRTEWNVRDSDGTVIFSLAPVLTGGSLATVVFARRLGKPCLHLSREAGDDGELTEQLAAFVQRHQIRRLNIAGPRVSGELGIEAFVKRILTRVFVRLEP